MPNPPVLVDTAGGGPVSLDQSPSTNTATADHAFQCQPGDTLVVLTLTSDTSHTANAPTGATVDAWNLRQKRDSVAQYGNAYIYTAKVTAAGTYTLAVTGQGGNSGAREHSFQAWQFRGSPAIGAFTIAAGSGLPSATLTTTTPNSALAWANVDWNVVQVNEIGRLTPNGSTPPVVTRNAYTTAARYWYVHHVDAGPVGAKTVGMSAPSGQKWALAVVEVTADTAAPGQVTGLTATAVSQNSIQLSWTAATDNIGVTSYTVRRGGSVVATGVTGTSWADTGLTAGTAYTYTVQAVDAAGNAGAESASAGATTRIGTFAATGTGTLTLSGAAPSLSGSLVLSAPGSLDANGRPGWSAALTADGSGALDFSGMKWGYKGTPNPLEFSGAGMLALSAPVVAVVTASALSGGSILDLRPGRIVVPVTGSIDVALSGAPALALDGHPNFWDDVALSGAGQLVWSPVEVRGSGTLQLSSVGTLQLDDPNAKPIYVWNGETWRQATVSVWNGRAWLPLRADDIRIY